MNSLPKFQMETCPECGKESMVKMTQTLPVLTFIRRKRLYCLVCGHMERMRK